MHDDDSPFVDARLGRKPTIFIAHLRRLRSDDDDDDLLLLLLGGLRRETSFGFCWLGKRVVMD